LYILADKIHPNNYEYSESETMDKIIIFENEFERFFSSIV